MIWNDDMLRRAGAAGMVTPFDPALVNPNSIDLRLGTSYRRPHPMWTAWEWHGDDAELLATLPTLPTWGDEQQMPPTGIVLRPREFILCCSLETVDIPMSASAVLMSKSSTGRMGLEHLHAGLGDAGFIGQWTWELHNVAPWPIALIPGRRYMQMVIDELMAPAHRDYSLTGRYQNQTGATPARAEREAR